MPVVASCSGDGVRWPGLAGPGGQPRRIVLEEEHEPGPARRQPACLGDGHGRDRIGLEDGPDLVGQVVDQVQLAVSVERLAGERSLVRLARRRRRRAPRRSIRRVAALRPSRRSALRRRSGAARRARPLECAPTCRSRMTSPSTSVIVTRASVPASRTDSIGATWRCRTIRRRSSAGSIRPPRSPGPSPARGPRAPDAGARPDRTAWSCTGRRRRPCPARDRRPGPWPSAGRRTCRSSRAPA